MSVICMRMKSHFHINGFTASHALKQTFWQLGNSRKWSIFQNFSGEESAQNPPNPRRPPKRVTPAATQKTARQLCSRKNPPPASESPWKLCNNDKEVQTPLRGFEVYHSRKIWGDFCRVNWLLCREKEDIFWITSWIIKNFSGLCLSLIRETYGAGSN